MARFLDEPGNRSIMALLGSFIDFSAAVWGYDTDIAGLFRDPEDDMRNDYRGRQERARRRRAVREKIRYIVEVQGTDDPKILALYYNMNNIDGGGQDMPVYQDRYYQE